MISTLITSDTALLGRMVARGGIVVFPTETVYGIGADSTNESACLQIYKIKNRPLDNPLIAHFDSINQIEQYCELNSVGRMLLEKFAPGPLTLVLRKKTEEIFSLGLDTLAVRIPGHVHALELIRAVGRPISAPSANPSGKPSFTREKDVVHYFDGKVDGILLAEPPRVGIESTVIDLSSEIPILLRPGEISYEELLFYLPNLLLAEGTNTQSAQLNQEGESFLPRSPGMKYRHYAPEAIVQLVAHDVFQQIWMENKNNPAYAFIGFDFVPREKQDCLLADNTGYMKNLYAFFLDADRLGVSICICSEPKSDSHKVALLNRISKAVSKK
jgi:L-threonylcarbamoyladenylate synthase